MCVRTGMTCIVMVSLTFLIPLSCISVDTWDDFYIQQDKFAVDLSYLQDAPAGKHGYLGVDRDKFIFEDGKEFRPWGVTMVGEACFPPHEIAPQIAERLSKLAVNLVCFRAFDSNEIKPPLIDRKWPGLLNPEWMDRLDYFLYQLETRGIYASFVGMEKRTLDGYDAVPEYDELEPGLQGYALFVPELQDIYLEFLDAFWRHRNRYSYGRQYRDTPSIVLFQLFGDNTIQPARLKSAFFNNDLYRSWNHWCEDKGVDKNEPLYIRNLSPLNHRFLSRISDLALTNYKNHLREWSVKSPIAGFGWISDMKFLFSLQNMDAVISELVWNEPLGTSLWHPNRRIIDIDPREESTIFAEWASTRLRGKPFVAGWRYPYPNRYRAELPLWLSAMALYQDWNGCIQMGYAHRNGAAVDRIDSFGSMMNDPLLLGLMPAAAMLFHQKQIAPAKKAAVADFVESDRFAEPQWTPQDVVTSRLADWMRVSVVGNERAGRDRIYAPSEPEDIEKEVKDFHIVPPIRHDPQRQLVCIESSQTQAFIGNLSHASRDDLPWIRVRSEEPFGVYCVNSLDGQSIPDSKRLWITLLSEAQNQGLVMISDEKGNLVRDIGKGPVQIKRTPARIYVYTEQSGWTVEAVPGSGKPLQEMAYQMQDRWLSFPAGENGTLFYRMRAK